MFKLHTTIVSTAATLVAALATLAGTAGAVPGPAKTTPGSTGPGLTTGTGCVAQCITQALVTTTSTAARVELKTTVPAHLVVSVWKQQPGGNGGGLVTPTKRSVSIPAHHALKLALFTLLEPDTTYEIHVKATDLKGHTAAQKGTFKTLAVKTTAQPGANGLSSGLGCSAECITRATFTQHAPAASTANVDIRTDTDAKVGLIVSRDAAQTQVVSTQQSPGYVRDWKTQVGGLDYATRYHVVVRATDREGRVKTRTGTFRTVAAVAKVTIHKLVIVNDGDKGRAKGELFFRYWFGGTERAQSPSFQKIGSGSVVAARRQGSSHPGVTVLFPLRGDEKLDIRVLAEECDGSLMKNCVVEAGGPSAHQYAWAGGLIDVSDLTGGALPPWYGTGVTPPAGHDRYLVLSTHDTYIRLHALATVDIEVQWP